MILHGSWLLLLTLQMFPGFGEFIFISVQITRTVFLFGVAYLPLLLSFALSFNILLSHHDSFSTMGSSLLKIIAMMTGELDIKDSLITNDQSFWFTKVVFMLFIILMTVVSMNMILGLAISDVGKLRCITYPNFTSIELHFRGIAHVKKLTMLVAAIQRAESLILQFRKIVPQRWKRFVVNPIMTSDATESFQTQVKITMKLNIEGYVTPMYLSGLSEQIQR